jgi:FAD/FMN-containing dehydrogenase
VVKNVAGYDLPKLLIGSYGTLSVLLELTFKLQPLPEKEEIYVCPAKSLRDAVEQGFALSLSRVNPFLVEGLNEAGAEVVGTGSGPATIVGCAGTVLEVAAHCDELVRAVPGAERLSEEEGSAVRKALSSFPLADSDDVLVARVAVLPNRLADLLGRLEDETRVRGLNLEIAAHAGSGVAWCQLAGPRNALDFELCAEWLRVHSRLLGGWTIFESLPRELWDRIDPWGFSEPALCLMKGVKRALDPGGRFSPGRFVGRI